MKNLYIVFALLSVFAVACREFAGRPQAKVTAQVINDNGAPVSGAQVVVLGSYGNLNAPLREGVSDQNGLFTATLPSDSTLSFQARAPGHHVTSRMYYSFQGRQAWETGRWEPWNPTVSIQLRKRTRRVPMFVKKVGEAIPILEKPVGYDLLIGDWIEPYGEGAVADFIVTAEVNSTNSTDYSGQVELRFPTPWDGVQLVRQHYGDDYGLWLPGVAPASGYTNRLLLVSSTWQPPDSRALVSHQNFDRDDNYYLRTRSQIDASGEVVSAMYGKIYWGIHYYPQPAGMYGGKEPKQTQGVIQFLYYLNPDGTRNTEFDVTRNLNPDPGIFSPRP